MSTNKPLTDEQKALHRVRMAKYRAENRDKYNAINRASQQRTPAKRAEYRKKWKETHRHIMREGNKKYAERHPEKHDAGVRLNNAIQKGRIIRPKACSRCGSGVDIHGHHPDYSKPLEVIWLCRKCHILEHRVRRPQ